MPRSNPNNDRHPYLRGGEYWMKKLAFWDRPESERTKEELIKRLQP